MKRVLLLWLVRVPILLPLYIVLAAAAIAAEWAASRIEPYLPRWINT